jgi:dimethylglycine dehydrogenase
MALTPMTNQAGRLVGDLTVACLPAADGQAGGPASTVVGGATANPADAERFVVFGSGIAERYYERWFDHQLAATGALASYRTLGWELCGLAIAGPNARAVLERVTDTDVSNHGLRFLDFRAVTVGLAPVWCGRLSYTGDLGYELWMPARYQRHVFERLTEAGRDLGLGLFGLHALNSLRLEKSFGSWAREYRPIYDPVEAGLDAFVRTERDFVGRDALVARHAEGGPGPERRLLSFTVDTDRGRDGADVIGDEPIWHGGEVVGWVTSGGYAHHAEASVALGYVPAGLADATAGFEIEIIGQRREARPIDGCLWDPDGDRMRA